MDKILINAGTWGIQQAGDQYFIRLVLEDNGVVHTLYTPIPPTAAREVIEGFTRLAEQHKAWKERNK